jgi:hypothetical protein
MPLTIYYDSFDTPRTSPERPKDQQFDALRLCQAQLTLSVMRGWTPVFSQVQGYDSTALLGFAGVGGAHAPFFRWLLQEGYIRILMHDTQNLVVAAISGFQDKEIVFSGWPEANGPKPQVERRALIEALRGSGPSRTIPDDVGARLDTVRAMSEAIAKAPSTQRASRRGDAFNVEIKSAAQRLKEARPDISEWLAELGSLNSTKRSVMHSQLNLASERGEPAPREVREIVNMLYNVVNSKCLHADMVSLTTPWLEPARIVKGLVANAADSSTFELHLDDDSVKDLKQVGWEELKTFLEKGQDLDETPEERALRAGNLVARISTGEGGRLAFLPKSIDKGFNALLWTGLAGAGGALLAAQGMTSAHAAIVAGAASVIFDAAGPLYSTKEFSQERLARKLTKKYAGLIAGNTNK